jgi:hypothetical protein
MAILNSAIYTAQTQAIKGFGSRASAANVSAAVAVATFTYTVLGAGVTGAETTGDTIYLGRLPANAVVQAANIRVSTDGIGGTGAITQIGDNGLATRYSSTSIAVASAVSTLATATNAQVVTPVAVAEGNEILTATLTFASAITAGTKITFFVPYTVVA